MWRTLFLVFGLACTAGCEGEADSAAAMPTKLVSLHVEGMMCEDSCARSVREILAAQQGVQDVVVNFEDKRATCNVDPEEFSTDEAIAELADQSFVATVQQ